MTIINVLITVSLGLIAAIIAFRSNERNIQISNITKERAEWRKKIRNLSKKIINKSATPDDKSFNKLYTELSLNLNPFDGEDKIIISLAKELLTKQTTDEIKQEFIDRISYLLKSDWERAKDESKFALSKNNLCRKRYCDQNISFCLHNCTKSVADTESKPITKKPNFVFYFIPLLASSGVIFYLASGLTEPFKNLIALFNDPKVTKTTYDWIQLIFWSVLYGSIWGALYIWFKISEKRIIDTFFSK